MTTGQRTILGIAGFLMLLIYINTAFLKYGIAGERAGLATVQFLLAVFLFYLSARKSY